MHIEPRTLCRFGAWGQLGTVALGMVFWVLGLPNGFVATCIGYLIVRTGGLVGIARTESAVAGPLVYPFVAPSFAPLYYFATR